jgi:hypothetical protein
MPYDNDILPRLGKELTLLITARVIEWAAERRRLN